MVFPIPARRKLSARLLCCPSLFNKFGNSLCSKLGCKSASKSEASVEKASRSVKYFLISSILESMRISLEVCAALAYWREGWFGDRSPLEFFYISRICLRSTIKRVQPFIFMSNEYGDYFN